MVATRTTTAARRIDAGVGAVAFAAGATVIVLGLFDVVESPGGGLATTGGLLLLYLAQASDSPRRRGQRLLGRGVVALGVLSLVDHFTRDTPVTHVTLVVLGVLALLTIIAGAVLTIRPRRSTAAAGGSPPRT